MRIPENTVADVVRDASQRMSDPRYAQTVVGTWVQSQPSATRYLTAFVKEFGGPEAVVNAVFHAALMANCFLRHAGRSVRAITFEELDSVASLDRAKELQKRQPALHDYLVANVENLEMRRVLMMLALAMDYVF
ncbi:MAG: hypothetical protein HY698_09020 [Deltaproteobacteria bacterium]|nr:hypothetical protein [Deltaproteobacteria bacterium]